MALHKMKNTREKLTKAFLLEAVDTFDMITGENNNFDSLKLPIALQSLGFKMGSEYSKEFEHVMTVDLEMFLQVICLCMEEPDWSNHEINEAFSVVDREDSGTAEFNDFKRILIKLGNDRIIMLLI
jgi:Ca2+-binding EF-hand superfamily protein